MKFVFNFQINILDLKFFFLKNENQQKFNAIHIIDAFFIEGENMIIQNNRIVSLKERNAQLNVFVKSITKNSRPEMKRVRAREVIDLENCEEEIINKYV